MSSLIHTSPQSGAGGWAGILLALAIFAASWFLFADGLERSRSLYSDPPAAEAE
ncbi:MAG: hypothetical protein KIS81_08790 [Maricaulaceae bacterium]|nr:hypothetical protein [Maricaulaceae bacterium]